MDVHAGVSGQKLAHTLGFVSREIVRDDVDLEIRALYNRECSRNGVEVRMPSR